MLFWISNISDNIIWIQHASNLGTAPVNLITPIEYLFILTDVELYICSDKMSSLFAMLIVAV